MSLLFCPLFIASAAGYFAAYRPRLTPPRLAGRAAIILAESAALLCYLYFHW